MNGEHLHMYIHTSTAASEKSHICCALFESAYVWSLRCIFMQVHEILNLCVCLCEWERKKARKQSSSVLTLHCVSVMPHFPMIPMSSVQQQLVLVQQLDPTLLPLTSLALCQSCKPLFKPSQNTVHMISVMLQGLTYSLSYSWEDGRKREREREGCF